MYHIVSISHFILRIGCINVDSNPPKQTYRQIMSTNKAHKLTNRQSVLISDLGSFSIASIFSKRAVILSPTDMFAGDQMSLIQEI